MPSRPDDAGGYAHLSLALAHKQGGRHAQALDEFARALELCGGDGHLRAQIHNERAHMFIEQGRCDLAIAEAESALGLGLDGGSGQAAFLLGLAHRREGRYAHALAALEKALPLCADDRKLRWRIHFETAHILLEQGKHEPAIAQAQAAIGLDRETGHAHFILGLAHEREKRYDEALAALDEALKLSRNDKRLLEQIHNERAHIFLERREYDQSIAEAQEALGQDGQDGQAAFYLGSAYSHREQYEEALAELDRALLMCGGDRQLRAHIRNERAHIFFAQGKYELSIAEFQETIRLGERAGDADFLLGLAYKHVGRYPEARAAFDEALGRSADDRPLQARIHTELADVLAAQGERELAVAQSQKAIELSRETDRATFLLSSAYRHQGRYEEALAECDKALRRCGDDRKLLSHIRNERGRIFSEQGRHELAIAELEAAISLDQESGPAEFLLGLAYKDARRHADALAAFGKALTLCAGDRRLLSQIHHETALIHYEQGRYDLAQEGFRRAIALGHDTDGTHLMLGRTHERRGELGPAERELRKAAEMSPSRPALRELIRLYTKLKKADSCVSACARYLELEEAHDARENQAFRDRIRALAPGRPPERDLRVKILRTPYFEPPERGALNYSLLPPLGMATLAAYLRANGIAIDQDDLHIRINHRNAFGGAGERIPTEVFCDEARILAYAGGAEDPGLDAVMDQVEALSPCAGYDVVLLSLIGDALNPSEAMFTLAFSRRLKTKHGPLIVVGGKDRELDALLERGPRHIDHIGRDKGEKLLFQLLTALRHGLAAPDIPDSPIRSSGLVLNSDPVRVWTEPDYRGLPLDLYEFRSPRRLEPEDEELRSLLDGFARSGLRAAQHKLMEGCFFECIFCGSSRTREVLALPPRKAVAQLRRLREDYGIRCFFFLNRLINISRRYVNEFCDEIIGTGLDILWSDCARADNLDRDTLLKMRRAGCTRLIYGLETASPRLLKLIDKRIDLDRLAEIVRWTDEAGILTGLEMISGFPGETREDLQATVDFLRRHQAHIDMLYFTTLYLEKGSKLFAEPEKYGVTNIAKADPYDRPPRVSVSDFGFDELGGLPWQDKRRAVNADFQYALEQTKDIGFTLPRYEAEHLIFYLYSKFDDKRKIVSLLKRAAAVL
jgi:tetratricopeptide (TPR) repeat protein